MIPFVVPRHQLHRGERSLHPDPERCVRPRLRADGGPSSVTLFGADKLILLVAVLFFCRRLLLLDPAVGATRLGLETDTRIKPRQAVVDAEQAVESTLAQLREGLSYIRAHRNISWSLVYLGIAASLVGVLGVLGPAFATKALGLQPKDFVVVVLPLGAGIVMGILILNSYVPLFATSPPHRGRPDRPRRPAGTAVRRRPDQPVSPGGRHVVVAARPIVVDVAAGGGRPHRVRRRQCLRLRRHPVPNAALGGAAGGRPRPGLRRSLNMLVSVASFRRSSSSLRFPMWSARPRSSSWCP